MFTREKHPPSNDPSREADEEGNEDIINFNSKLQTQTSPPLAGEQNTNSFSLKI
jgi:hypothetical protein